MYNETTTTQLFEIWDFKGTLLHDGYQLKFLQSTYMQWN